MPREAGSLLGLKVSVRSTAWRNLVACFEGKMPPNMTLCRRLFCVQVVGGKMTEMGRLGAFITKVKKGSLADVVGHLRAGETGLQDNEVFFSTDNMETGTISVLTVRSSPPGTSNSQN